MIGVMSVESVLRSNWMHFTSLVTWASMSDGDSESHSILSSLIWYEGEAGSESESEQ